jgi:hypothetical protein
MTLNEARMLASMKGYTFGMITPESENGPEAHKIDTKTFENWCLKSFANEMCVLQEETTNQLMGKNIRVYTVKDGWISKKPIVAFFGIKTK